MAIRLRFDLEPARALAFFRAKGLATSFRWTDQLHEAHDAAFTVAAMMDVDLLRDVRAAVDAAIAEGTTLAEFRKRLRPLLVEKGWWGRGEVIDPSTGEVRDAELGTPRRLQTIFRTNLRTSYAAGHWSQIVEHAAEAPYLLYDAVLDDRTRQDHRAWDGTVLRVDDAWWAQHYPPNGWNCRCSVVQLDERQLRELGKSGPDRPPSGGSRPWRNPSTGEVHQVPQGIDPGWGYHPGRSQVARLRETLAAKAQAAGPELGAPAVAKVARQQERRPGLWSRADQVISVEGRVTQQAIEAELRHLPPAQLDQVRRFVDAHPQQLIAVQARHMSPASRAARALRSEVVPKLPEKTQRYGIHNYATKMAGVGKGVSGFTNVAFEHVVIKVKSGQRLDGHGAAARKAVARAVDAWRMENRRWSVSMTAGEEIAGERHSALVTLLHELGHQVHYWARSPKRPAGLPALTQYSESNHYEWHAEHFTAWVLDRDALADWSPEVAAYFDELVDAATTSTEKRY